MDINVLRSFATVVCFIALAGVFFWAYHPKRKGRFEQDAQLLFGDDLPINRDSTNSANKEKHDGESDQ